MLHIENLHAYYGKSHVLHGVAFDVQPGEIVALLGRNGSGRSTTAKAIMGLVDWEGTLQWKGQDLNGKKAYEVAHLDTIKGGIAQQTAAKTERAVVENIRAKGNRPAENGVGSGSGITVKNDVSKLSRQDRQEIARRVARGENIRF